MIRKNKITGISSLWTTHNIEVTTSGVASSSGNRNGTRWYAKKISNGQGVEHELSTDEIKAIKSATKRAKK